MDSNSSIISSFKFISYKVDEFNFSMAKDLSLLSYNGNLNDKWEMNIGISQPLFFKSNKYYVSSIECDLVIKKEGADLLKLKSSVSGMFTVEDGYDKDILDKMVIYQFPTILFPYMRTVITTFLASSGFGSFSFPLINIANIVKNDQNASLIKIVE